MKRSVLCLLLLFTSLSYASDEFAPPPFLDMELLLSEYPKAVHDDNGVEVLELDAFVGGEHNVAVVRNGDFEDADFLDPAIFSAEDDVLVVAPHAVFGGESSLLQHELPLTDEYFSDESLDRLSNDAVVVDTLVLDEVNSSNSRNLAFTGAAAVDKPVQPDLRRSPSYEVGLRSIPDEDGAQRAPSPFVGSRYTSDSDPSVMREFLRRTPLLPGSDKRDPQEATRRATNIMRSVAGDADSPQRLNETLSLLDSELQSLYDQAFKMYCLEHPTDACFARLDTPHIEVVGLNAVKKASGRLTDKSKVMGGHLLSAWPNVSEMVVSIDGQIGTINLFNKFVDDVNQLRGGMITEIDEDTGEVAPVDVSRKVEDLAKSVWINLSMEDLLSLFNQSQLIGKDSCAKTSAGSHEVRYVEEDNFRRYFCGIRDNQIKHFYRTLYPLHVIPFPSSDREVVICELKRRGSSGWVTSRQYSVKGKEIKKWYRNALSHGRHKNFYNDNGLPVLVDISERVNNLARKKWIKSGDEVLQTMKFYIDARLVLDEYNEGGAVSVASPTASSAPSSRRLSISSSTMKGGGSELSLREAKKNAAARKKKKRKKKK